ncbi:hypothetical protein BC938DRAFT_478366 [Jimgerdemannia flammicorona]|uniref:SNF2 family N-terminal domain-containing protein n=1 Tax=Jimgerdemannia flammicorona TaxID=994334 RepID=A0A433QYG9_9FUNG|nr:hypothetical protein BC938DRAFT_478366 [Jimgerdemannia flammicorona]
MSSPITTHPINSNGVAAGLNVPSGGLTREKLNGLLQRAKLLQANGAKEENHPEFARLMGVLRSLQQQQAIKAQQQHHMSNGVNSQQNSPVQQPAYPQLQQVAQPASVQAHAQTQQAFSQQAQQYQLASDASSSVTSLFSQYVANRAAPATSNQTVTNNVATTPSMTPQTAFTQAQLAALKYQILAFKLISKNMPVPPNLQQAVFSPTNVDGLPTAKEQSSTIPSKIAEAAYAQHPSLQSPTAANQLPSSSAAPGSQANGAPVSAAHYNAYTTPYSLLKKQISSYAHASRQQRLLIPSLSPVGLDPYALAQERDRRVKARVEYRISELEKLPSNLANESLDFDEEQEYDIKRSSSAKIKATIELKGLRLLPKQKRLREEIVKGMTKATMLATSVDRAAYRRMKKQSLREARMTEKLERQQRIDREKREKQKHIDYLQTICAHGADMVRHHRSHQAKQVKLGRGVLSYHQHIEKEEQKRAERISKERLRALRNDDEEAYMKLIDEAKDTRLTHLLRQTGTYLESLSQAVIAQQNEHAETETDEALKEDDLKDEEGDGLSFEVEGKKIDYFQIAHRVKESVEQPNMLLGGTLKEYQIKGLQWMVSLYNNRLNGILADEMGLGKTIQTISLITYLIERKRQNGPFLIIVPLSTLTNWTLEFEKWSPGVIKVVYKGVPEVRKMIQQTEIKHQNFQVLLTTYEYIIKDRPVLSKIKWVHIIIDEGHRLKNSNSKLTSVLTQYYSTRYRLILTGTPLQNNLPELWALLNFVLPKIFNSVKGFEEWFNTPFANSGGQDKIELNEEEQLLIIKRLHKVLRPFLLRRLKKDVESELPDKVEKIVKCKFSALQGKLYQQMKKHGMLYTANGEKGRTGIKGLNNTIMQLRKICNHPFVFEDVENMINPLHVNNTTLYRTSGKFELLDRILPKLKATGHRVCSGRLEHFTALRIVTALRNVAALRNCHGNNLIHTYYALQVLIFFQMTQIMNIMEDFLQFKGYQYLRLDGSTKADDRSQLLKVFNAPESQYFAFLLSTRAGGLGLNLQTADTVIIFDSDWNPHQDLQAQDRAHRIGQTKEVRIFRLITEKSIEESILARAQFKLDIDGKVIQAGKFDNRSTDEDREAFLRTLLEDKADNEINDVDDEEAFSDDELNMVLKRSDQELAIFGRMDVERDRADEEAWRRSGARGKRPERLMAEWELPEVYRNDEQFTQETVDLVMGRGQRSRTDVRYDDGLTEEQWLNVCMAMQRVVSLIHLSHGILGNLIIVVFISSLSQAIEDDDMDVNDLIKQKDDKRRRREEKKARKSQVVKQDEHSQEEAETPARRRRGRPKREESVTTNDLEEERKTPGKKRGRQKKSEDTPKTEDSGQQNKRRRAKKGEAELRVPETVAPHIRKQMTKIFEECYEAVDNCYAEEDGYGINGASPAKLLVPRAGRQETLSDLLRSHNEPDLHEYDQTAHPFPVLPGCDTI